MGDRVSAETVREACRRNHALDGADAQALEHALTITEAERDEARRERDEASARVDKVVFLFDEEKKQRGDDWRELAEARTQRDAARRDASMMARSAKAEVRGALEERDKALGKASERQGQIDRAIEASNHGSQGDAIQAMLAILEGEDDV